MSIFKRKVQDNKQAGSFFIILPRPWAEARKLKQSDIMLFEEQPDGNLLLRPVKEAQHE